MHVLAGREAGWWPAFCAAAQADIRLVTGTGTRLSLAVEAAPAAQILLTTASAGTQFELTAQIPLDGTWPQLASRGTGSVVRARCGA